MRSVPPFAPATLAPISRSPGSFETPGGSRMRRPIPEHTYSRMNPFDFLVARFCTQVEGSQASSALPLQSGAVSPPALARPAQRLTEDTPSALLKAAQDNSSAETDMRVLLVEDHKPLARAL